MKVLKKIFLVAISLIAGLSMVACGGGDNSKNDPNKDPNNSTDNENKGKPDQNGLTEIKLAFWTPAGKDVQNALKPFIDDFNANQKSLVEEFNKNNPNSKKTNYYTFELTPQSGYKGINDTLVTASSSGNLPKLVMGYPDTFSLYNTGRKVRLLKLDNFIKNPKLGGFTQEEYADLNPELLKEGSSYTVDGLWSVPVVKSTEFLFVNKTIFDAANISLDTISSVQDLYDRKDDLLNAAKTILPEDNYNQFKVVLGIDSGANAFITSLMQNEDGYTEIEGNKGVIKFANEETGEPTSATTNIIRYFKELYDNKIIATKLQLNVKYTSQDFLDGHIFATIGSSGGLKYNSPYNPSNKKYGDFDMEVLKIPAYTPDSLNQKSILQGPSIAIFKDDSVEDQTTSDANIAAMRFVHMLLQPKTQAAYIKASPGYLPVNNKTFDEQSIKDIISNEGSSDKQEVLLAKVYKLLKEVKDNLFVTPVFNKSSLIREKVDTIFSPVFTNDTLKDIYQGVEPSMSASDTPTDKNEKVDAVIISDVKKIINDIKFNK